MSAPPSFGSFPSVSDQPQPSFSSFPEPPSKPAEFSKREHKKDRSSKRSSKDAEDSSRKKRKHYESSSSRASTSRSDSYSAPRPSSSKHAQDALQYQLTVYPRRGKATSSTSIISDTQGDPDFSRYGSLSTAEVPRFFRIGSGNVLGAPLGLRIMKAHQGKRKALVLLPSNQARLDRYIDKHQARKLSAKDRKVYQLLPGQERSRDAREADAAAALEAKSSFIGLLDEDIPSPPDPLAEPDFRQLDGPLSASESDSDSDHEAEGHPDSVLGRAASYLDRLTFKNAELSSHVHSHPQDVQAWLDFVHHQDVFLSNTRAEFGHDLTTGAQGSRTTKRRTRDREERKAIAETKLDILDKALSKNKGDVELIRERLTTGEAIWTVQELSKEWNRALKKVEGEPEGQVLWRDWVFWRSRDARNFQGNATAYEAACEALKHLRSTNQCLEVFDKAVRCLKQAGYSERANAAYQCLMELNFFCPTSLQDSSLDEQLDGLAEWWDSEAPRIGENGSKGWRNTTEDDLSSSRDRHSETDAAVTIAVAEDDGFEQWAAAELKEAAQHQYSGRMRDLLDADPNEGEDALDVDPDSVTPFSDLREILFKCYPGAGGLSPTDQRDAIFSYLAFLGVGMLAPGFCTQEQAPPDELCSASQLERFLPPAPKGSSFEVIGGEPMESSRQSGLKSPADGWGRHWPFCDDLLFSGACSGWPSFWKNQDWSAIDVVYVKNVLDTMICYSDADSKLLESLKVLRLSLEAAQNTKAASKLAKQMLSADQHNIRLWIAFANLEISRGRYAEARTVFQQTAAALPHMPKEAQNHASSIWLGWAELEWQTISPSRAMAVLAASVQETPSANTAVLKAMHATEKQVSYARDAYSALLQDIRRSNHPNGHAVVASAILLEYLCAGLEPASALYDEECYAAKPLPLLQERLYMSYAKLLYQHSLHQAYKPGVLRDLLTEALQIYPTNSLFQNLFFYNESRTRLQNRVRTLLDGQIWDMRSTQAIPAPLWLYRIFAETHLDARGYNAKAVQGLFERATTALSAKPSVALWQLYLAFAAYQQDGSLIKSIIQRAAQECPHAKDLYMICFYGRARAAFRQRELQELHGAMEDTQLRLFKPIKTFMEIGSLQFGGDDAMDDEGDIDEAFVGLADRQRLLPV